MFTARYTTRCPACDELIHPGDSADYTTEHSAPVAVHATCPDPTDPLTVDRPPCPRCFTVPAANGACLCA